MTTLTERCDAHEARTAELRHVIWRAVDAEAARRRLSDRRLALEAGVGYADLSRWRHGVTQPRWHSMRALARWVDESRAKFR